MCRAISPRGTPQLKTLCVVLDKEWLRMAFLNNQPCPVWAVELVPLQGRSRVKRSFRPASLFFKQLRQLVVPLNQEQHKLILC